MSDHVGFLGQDGGIARMDAREQTQRSFGDWLRQRRRELDLTRAELARQVGCSTVTLRKLEAEERRPSKQMAERLAEVLQVAPDDRAAFLRFARGDPFAAPGQPEGEPTNHAIRHNLPSQLTSFIGREAEVAAVRRLLQSSRLVTLTGTGGAGKTRLSLQVAASMIEAFSDGVWSIELAPLADAALVPQTVASVLGVKEMAGQPILAVLLAHLRAKRLLLVLDNCEHLIQACAELAEKLLRDSPQLTVLATSREALGVVGESVYSVPSLSLPDPNQVNSIDTMTQAEAVQLFVERAVGVLPGFALTSQNAPAVAQICRQLDGMPLAIELAAARVKVLRVEEIAARLNDRFRLLTTGSRTALPRHQTLQALIDWSYDLLPASERALLHRLSVFAGGWTLAAAEAVGAGEGVAADEVLDLLTQLVNKSLVVTESEPGAAARYRLLETIRQYVLAKLKASGESDAVWRRLAEYYIELAKTRNKSTDPNPPDLDYYRRLEPERDNLRAALAWCQSASGNTELGLRLAAEVMFIWIGRGYWNEAKAFLAATLAHAEGIDHLQARARVLYGLGTVTAFQGDYAIASTHLDHSLRLARELSDRPMIGRTLVKLGGLVALEQGDAATARRQLEESLAVFRELGNTQGVASALLDLGSVAVMQEDAARATALLEEGLALAQALKLPETIAMALIGLGLAAQLQGDYARARRLHEESLARLQQHLGSNIMMPWASQGSGEAALAQGDAPFATTRFTEALTLFHHEGDRGGIAYCLAGLAGVAVLHENPERAARLWGAAEALRVSIGARPAPATRATRERLMAAAREQLGEEAFAAAWAEGEAMTAEQAVALALEQRE